MDLVRVFAWFYALMFVGVTALGYMPPLHDPQGYLFGLFKLELWDDALHLGSGIWAGVAGYLSYSASRKYFRIFGPLYFGDGLLGLLAGMGYLDFGIFLHGPADLPLQHRIMANLPHIMIGGVAILIGYVGARRMAETAATA